MEVYEQLSIWDALAEDSPIEGVEIKGALNVRAIPISECDVRLAYGDLVLIVAMIEDYIKGLDVIKADDIQWQVYYRNKFKKISDTIQSDLGYDYEQKKKQCLKKHEKESDIGEDAMILAIKKQAQMKKEEKKQEVQDVQEQIEMA